MNENKEVPKHILARLSINTKDLSEVIYCYCNDKLATREDFEACAEHIKKVLPRLLTYDPGATI